MVLGTFLAAAAFGVVLHHTDWEQCANESEERVQRDDVENDGLVNGMDQ